MSALKRKHRRVMPRRGIMIVGKVDRGQLIIEDPQKYFAEARVKARQQVERDLERERLQDA